MTIVCSGLDVWSGYIGAGCLGIIIGLVAAAVMADTAAARQQAKLVLRTWQPKIVRRKDPRQ